MKKSHQMGCSEMLNDKRIPNLALNSNRKHLDQGCGVGARVGVARSRGNEQGVGVGVDQTASIPTPERFV